VEINDGDPNDYLSGLDNLIMGYEAIKDDGPAELAIAIAIEKFPGNLQLRLNLATYMTRRENYPRALEIFETALSLEPNNVYANMTIGTIYIMDKNYKDAIPYLEKVISVQPENVTALQYLFSSYYNTEQIEKGSEIKKRWEKVK